MVARLDSDDEEISDAAREEIEADPLSIEVRTGWHTPGDQDAKPDEYWILLCTDGPAVRITGDLNSFREPDGAKLQYQDWSPPWENYQLGTDAEAILLRFAQCFYLIW